MNGKRNKGRRWLASLLVVILAAGVGLWLAHLYLYRVAGQMNSFSENMSEITEEIEWKVTAGGVPALKQIEADIFHGWGEDRGMNLAEDMNAVLLNKDGTILAQTGTLATEGLSTEELTHMNLFRAEQSRDVEEWREPNLYLYSRVRARLGLIVDDQNEIIARFLDMGDEQGRLVSFSSSTTGAETPRAVGRLTMTEYRKYFPRVDESMYQMATADDGWMYEEDLSEASAASQASFAEVEEYVGWEDGQLAQVDQLRAQIVPLSSAQAGRVLAVFFNSNDETHASEIERARMERLAGRMILPIFVLALLWWILLAVFVYLDAKNRAFRPAMWGLLTLLGNVVGWLVYMLVRPGRNLDNRCPACGTALKPAFAFCPACGKQTRGRCPACLRAVEDGWAVCPYCGKALHKADARAIREEKA